MKIGDLTGGICLKNSKDAPTIRTAPTAKQIRFSDRGVLIGPILGRLLQQVYDFFQAPNVIRKMEYDFDRMNRMNRMAG